VDAILRRERWVVGICLVLMVLGAWLYLIDMARDMAGMAMPSMLMPSPTSWTPRDLGLAFVMWSVMMVAMMVPSAGPMVLAFLAVNGRRRERGGAIVSGWVFVVGYVAVWTAYSLAATLAQWGLHEAALVSSSYALTSPLVMGGILIAAGIYQWTPLKRRCLVGCRSPLSFLMSRWREGRWGAWWMGLEHGLFCVGCCWILMTLLFVTGVMNLPWVAAIAVFVIAEKLLPYGAIFGRVTGVALAVIGLIFLRGIG